MDLSYVDGPSIQFMVTKLINLYVRAPFRCHIKVIRRRSPSHEKPVSKSSKRRSSERKLKRVSEERVRDYDAEEKIGMDDNGCEKSSSKSDNMDISP